MLRFLVRPRGVLTTGLLVIAVGTSSSAAVFDVTKTADTLDGTCDADCSFREALEAANETAGFDTILVPAGTYEIEIAGQAEDQNGSGDFDVLDNVEIIGVGADLTIIDAVGLDRVFHVAPRLDLLPGEVPLTNVSFEAFTISGGEGVVLGGGIRVGAPGVLTLTDCAVRDNLATRGGGINMEGSTLTIERCEIAGNAVGGNVQPGGGMRIENGAVTVTNSTISNNETPALGAAIYILPGTATIDLVNVTIAENGLAFDGTLTGSTFFNSIIEGGCEFLIIGDPTPGPATSLGGNIESPAADCFTALGSDQQNVTVEALNLGALANNNGRTRTHELLPGSVAIDSALDVGCPDVDQRLLPRPNDGDGNDSKICDVGAFERPDSDLFGGDLFADLTVSGPKQAGATIFYTATITNDGAGIQVDDPAVDEFRNVLPLELSLVDATADRGVVNVDDFNNIVTWNGQLFAAEQAEVTIEAVIGFGPTPTVIINQGLVRYDGDGDAVNESSRVTDDPALPGDADPTSLCVFRSSNPLAVFIDGFDTGDFCYWSAVAGAATR